MELTEIKGKNVTVIGLARSGAGAANLLTEFGAHVTITDIKTAAELKEYIRQLSPAVNLALGAHPENIFVSADMLVVSPGVPLNISPIAKAKSKGIPVIGELELAYQVIRSQKTEHRKQTEFLAVTGTNGKSTTTALLDFMMRKGEFKTILGGNIGNALTEQIYQQRAESRELSVDFIVAEISSFQLESIKDFRPKGATIVNITPDHLDRYHSLGEYRDAKARIFENQGEGDSLVLNRDDPETMRLKREKLQVKDEKLKIVYFSRREKVEGLYSKEGMVYSNLPDLPLSPCPFPLIKADEIKIKGVHNLENAMAASAMALLAGCRVEAVIDSLKEFSGLEHRLEFVRKLNGVTYYNDSKGTNVGAVIKSLESFSEPVVLIAGGRDKAGEFSLLRQLVKERVKALVLIGEASEKIKKALGDITDTVMAGDLRNAVNKAKDVAAEGDVVLLSPACASFDMFENFEDRGRQFKKIVMETR
jgi:UDP-N-acetylmuramoylalanine--D-glutamate ligase